MTQSSGAPLLMVRDVSKSFGPVAADALAVNADVIVAVGIATPTSQRRATPSSATRDVRFVNLNVLAFDAAKNSAEMVLIDARRRPPGADRSPGGLLRRGALQPAGRWSRGGLGEGH
jgi:hypothetical protein